MPTRTKSQIGKSSRRCGTAAERAAKEFLEGDIDTLSVERCLKSMAGLGGDDLIVTKRDGTTYSVEVKERAVVPLRAYALVSSSGVCWVKGGLLLSECDFIAYQQLKRHRERDRPVGAVCPMVLKQWVRNADVLMMRRKDRNGWAWLFYIPEERRWRSECV